MNLLYIGSDAQGVRSVFEIWKSFDFGGRVMARTVRDFIPSLAKTIEKCARKPEGLHSVIKLRGSRGSNRFLGTPRIFGLVEGDGVKLGARTWKLAALAMLSGCSGLPLDGPAKQDMISGASVIASNPPYAVAMDYALVDINPIVLDCLADADTVSLSRTFGGRPSALRVGAGDVLGVSVFESSSGNLFASGGAPAGSNSRQGNFVTIPNLKVDSSGAISVPYAGRVHVAGLTLPGTEREIESKLASRVVEPQVILSMVEQNAATVTVVGDGGSNRVKLTGAGERILDVVSEVGGGLRGAASDMEITLQRKNRVATAFFPTLISRPEENIFVQPNDVIYVNSKPAQIRCSWRNWGLDRDFDLWGRKHQ